MSESPSEPSRESSPGIEAPDGRPPATAEELSQQLQSLTGREGRPRGFNLMGFVHAGRATQPRATQEALFLPETGPTASPAVASTQELPPPPFPNGPDGSPSPSLLGLSVAGTVLPSPASSQLSAPAVYSQPVASEPEPSSPIASRDTSGQQVQIPNLNGGPGIGSQSISGPVSATVTHEQVLDASFGQIQINYRALDGSQYGTGYVRYLKVAYYEMVCKAVGLTNATQSHVDFYGYKLTRASIAKWLGQPFGTLNNWRTFYTKCHKAYNALTHHDGQLVRDTHEELLWQVLRRWIESGPEVLHFDYPHSASGDAIDRSWHTLAVTVKLNKITGGIAKLQDKPVYAALM